MTTQEILEAARGAKAALALADGTVRAQALRSMAAQLCSPANITAILAANADDMAAAKGRISEVMLDRLALTEERIRAMAKGIEEVAALPDPVGRVLKRVERPNGLPVPPLPGSLLLNQYPAFLPTRFPRELIFLPLPWHLSASVLNADLLFPYHFLRHL